jgi:hypothetical protein
MQAVAHWTLHPSGDVWHGNAAGTGANGHSRYSTSRLSAVQPRRPAAASAKKKKRRTVDANKVISPNFLPVSWIAAGLVDFNDPGFRAASVGSPPVRSSQLWLPMLGNHASAAAQEVVLEPRAALRTAE